VHNGFLIFEKDTFIAFILSIEKRFPNQFCCEKWLIFPTVFPMVFTSNSQIDEIKIIDLNLKKKSYNEEKISGV